MREILFLIYCLLMACSVEANAVSLSGRPTDDSVCDLSPMTNYHLTRKIFVPSGTMNVSDIYGRLALMFVVKECKNSQILVLHSEFGESEDERAFRVVTSELCSVANVQRESTATSEYPYSFQVKCRISKIQEATSRLAIAEREKNLETIIAENAPTVRERDESTDQPTSINKDCGKLGYGAVVLGLGGRCTR